MGKNPPIPETKFLDASGKSFNTIPPKDYTFFEWINDTENNPFDGSKTFKVNLPKDIPARAFWSLTLYDNQTRSILPTPQRYPRAGSQSYPSPAAEANKDGSTTLYFAPEQPDGVARGNWIQTMPDKGWFVILRLYSPLETYFSKEWRPSEIELVR